MKDLSDPNALDGTNGNSFIRLSLRKPREWRVALTTSVSSPAVMPPAIQLWDEEQGRVLLDTSNDMGETFSKSRSASFIRRNIFSPIEKVRSNERRRSSTRSYRDDASSTRLNGEVSVTNQCTNSHVDHIKYGRSKSLSARERQNSLVKPEEYVRPRTPVMVARRISLTRDRSSQTGPMDTPVHVLNGITTHHRKQQSDSSSVSDRRKVKHNVSFGKVDTFEDTSSSSTFSKNTVKEKVKAKSRMSRGYSSSPRVVLTEVRRNENRYVNSMTPETNRTQITSQRSRSQSSGKPVSVKEESDDNFPAINGAFKPPRDVSADYSVREPSSSSGRKSRMELFMCENDKNRFSVIHVPEPPPHIPACAYQQQYIPYPKTCNRSNCPQTKSFDNPDTSRMETKYMGPVKQHNILHFKSTLPKELKDLRKILLRGKQLDQQNDTGRKKRRKHPKNRFPSRNREMMMSSSSSESDHGYQGTRHPPCRRQRSQNSKGDRLLGVNGQCVRTVPQAEGLLHTSDQVVRLHLQRNESLPRPGLEPTTMGSNISRHSGKGLTGRRTQSSGNLCNGKAPGVHRFFSPCGRGTNDSVGPRDRYKFCGSLPNHLDTKEEREPEDSALYRDNNNVRASKNNDLVLRLQPLVPSESALQDKLRLLPVVPHDQGYASERSPEDELPPALPPPHTADQLTCPVHHPHAKPVYPFLQKNSTFTVTLMKSTRGLGLSVTGGVDTEEPWPGLIRIKRLFPHQPAWQCGQLAQGDFLLVVNNTSLVGLTNYEALEVLRTTPAEVMLTVCRPPPELQVLSTTLPLQGESAPLPPRRDTTSSLQLPLKRMDSFGEFEISLKKVNGSLGFTLRKEDESVLGHYVRALVREPALSDGRVKPGDKIVAVNGVDMSPMSHEEAVMFLRQCGQEVQLKLYRDPVQTPVQALSPTEHHRTFKPILRKEAQDMLSDLAVKKSMSAKDSSSSSTLSSTGRTSSPRKRRLTKTPSPDLDIETERSVNQLSWSDDVLERVTPGTTDDERPRRPDSLNFAAERKPQFQFSAEGSGKQGESFNSDSYDRGGSPSAMELELGVGPLPSEPVSMPPLLTSASDTTIGFSYRNPAYRSANPAPSKSKSSLYEELPENRCSDNDLTGGGNAESSVEGSKGLLKWKGVVFTPEDGAEGATSPEDSISQITEVDSSCNQVLVVELNRGWNSRLGFSLQQSGRNTSISAIHPDSVASRDGRLKTGDQLITVNDESVEGMSTNEVINLLRKIRGSICITVWRKTA